MGKLKKLIYAKIKRTEKNELIKIQAWIQYIFVTKWGVTIFGNFCIYLLTHIIVPKSTDKELFIICGHIAILMIVNFLTNRKWLHGIAFTMIILSLNYLLGNYYWIKIIFMVIMYSLAGAIYMAIKSELNKRIEAACAEHKKRTLIIKQSFEKVVNRVNEIIEKWDDDKKIVVFRWHDVIKDKTNYWQDINWILSLNQKLQMNIHEDFEISLTHRELFPEAYSRYNTEGRILINRK